jgi:isopentenyl phosphate kinase
MTTFIKLGGSVITDKTGQEAPDQAIISSLAADLRTARNDCPELRIVLGHGSGSFGHHYAARYGIHRGLAPDADWYGFALTAGAALRLNRIVVDTLLTTEIPAISLQPSASLRSSGGRLVHWETAPVEQALAYGLIPVIHGDVAFDDRQGSAIISTEDLLAHLALETAIRPDRLILVGESAVYDSDPHINPHAERIPQIHPANIDSILHRVGRSHAIDVTGGMRSKIELMWRLVQALPDLVVHLIGPTPGLLAAVLRDEPVDAGTIISNTRPPDLDERR